MPWTTAGYVSNGIPEMTKAHAQQQAMDGIVDF